MRSRAWRGRDALPRVRRCTSASRSTPLWLYRLFFAPVQVLWTCDAGRAGAHPYRAICGTTPDARDPYRAIRGTTPHARSSRIPKFGIVLVVVLVLGALGFRDRKETDGTNLFC